MANDMSNGLDSISDADLAARAAWLHYAGGLTQSVIAQRFGISTTRAHRMIARATRDGLIRVFVDASVSSCIALEDRLCARYGLAHCTVAPDLAETTPTPMRALGQAGASLLMRLIAQHPGEAIGIGHGTTLAAAVEYLPGCEGGETRFVSLLGGLTRKFAANPFDVIHKLAEKTGAEAFLMPAPLFANSADDRRVMMAQDGLREIMKTIESVQVSVVGIGSVQLPGSLARANVFDPDTPLDKLQAEGARAEVLGQFLDANGARVPTPYDGRVMAVDLDDLRGREVYALAGGSNKTEAIDAAMLSGVFTGLITDEATARRLVDDVGARNDPAGQ
ncbi:sugar-binding transcriptional regulator [Rhodovibrio salinarum]|nr:sugar-binding transcriptional regulator [Rhodovibrio salinarum]